MNVCAAMLGGGPSLGIAGSFLGSEPFRDFDFSIKRIKSDASQGK